MFTNKLLHPMIFLEEAECIYRDPFSKLKLPTD